MFMFCLPRCQSHRDLGISIILKTRKFGRKTYCSSSLLKIPIHAFISSIFPMWLVDFGKVNTAMSSWSWGHYSHLKMWTVLTEPACWMSLGVCEKHEEIVSLLNTSQGIPIITGSGEWNLVSLHRRSLEAKGRQCSSITHTPRWQGNKKKRLFG